MKGRIKRTDENQTSRAPLPIIGKLKVGKKTEKGYPTSLDYFRATGKYKQHFHERYGQQPNRVQVIFISDDINSICQESLELRDSAGKLFGKSDGYNYKVWSKKKEEYRYTDTDETPNVAEIAAKAANSKKGWEEVLTLRFILPKITGIAGMWQLTTKAKASSVPQIISAFDFVQENAGTVVNIPFDLEIEKVKSQKPGSKSVFPVVQLIPNVDKDNMAIVRNYLNSGHEVQDIPKLLKEGQPKQIGSGEQE